VQHDWRRSKRGGRRDKMNLLDIYYVIKPALPRRMQIFFRSKRALWKQRYCKEKWPIDENAGDVPQGWRGWPNGKQFALVLTHDVESALGLEKCVELMNVEVNLGFRSSFNFVPERYSVSRELRDKMTNSGFEVGIHGLKHDGKLYRSRKIFGERARRINEYAKEWNVVGFRSPAMHHNLEWLLELNIEYDASTFDTDPFEPQSDGIGTIFPVWVPGNECSDGYVELPYTLPQDFTLFVLLREGSIDIWKKKLEWIANRGGMALVNTHPCYMHFGGSRQRVDEYPVQYYVEFLRHIKHEYGGFYWHVLPRQVARFWETWAENSSGSKRGIESSRPQVGG
jgi:peptidoglycan/xylan/chitin deacetylase (PgdA/CDA1 family)